MASHPAESLVRSLLPPPVLAEESSGDGDVAGLHPAERQLILGAVPARQREFAAGRLLARRLLEHLGAGTHPLLRGPDRDPLWPRGIVGSITHTGGYCAVAVAPSDAVMAIGLDAERESTLDADLRAIVCTERELEWLASRPADQRTALGTLIFSAKECAFKAHFPLTRRWLEFTDAEVDLDLDRGRFTITFLADASAQFRRGLALGGVFARRGGLLLTALTVRAEDVVAGARSISPPPSSG